jgi:hypothetical protein
VLTLFSNAVLQFGGATLNFASRSASALHVTSTKMQPAKPQFLPMMLGTLRITEHETQLRDEPVSQLRDGPVEASTRTYEVPDLLRHRRHTTMNHVTRNNQPKSHASRGSRQSKTKTTTKMDRMKHNSVESVEGHVKSLPIAAKRVLNVPF